MALFKSDFLPLVEAELTPEGTMPKPIWLAVDSGREVWGRREYGCWGILLTGVSMDEDRGGDMMNGRVGGALEGIGGGEGILQ